MFLPVDTLTEDEGLNMKQTLKEKLIIRKQRELSRICLDNQRHHPIPISELIMVQNKYDGLISASQKKEETTKYFGLLG